MTASIMSELLVGSAEREGLSFRMTFEAMVQQRENSETVSSSRNVVGRTHHIRQLRQRLLGSLFRNDVLEKTPLRKTSSSSDTNSGSEKEDPHKTRRQVVESFADLAALDAVRREDATIIQERPGCEVKDRLEKKERKQLEEGKEEDSTQVHPKKRKTEALKKLISAIRQQAPRKVQRTKPMVAVQKPVRPLARIQGVAKAVATPTKSHSTPSHR